LTVGSDGSSAVNYGNMTIDSNGNTHLHLGY